jgi:hypothetical protein
VKQKQDGVRERKTTMGGDKKERGGEVKLKVPKETSAAQLLLHAVQISDPIVHKDDLGREGLATGFPSHVQPASANGS